jgi:nitroreductase
MDMEQLNAGIATTYAMLAAHCMGIGSCYIGLAQIAMNQEKSLKKMAKVRGTVMAVVTLGYPAVTYNNAPPRRGLKVKGLQEH